MMLHDDRKQQTLADFTLTRKRTAETLIGNLTEYGRPLNFCEGVYQKSFGRGTNYSILTNHIQMDS